MGAAVAEGKAVFSIEKDGFRAWLEGKEPWETVGRGRLPKECPLARYLCRFEQGVRRPYAVHPTYIGVSASGNPPWEYIAAPAWVEKFVNNIDRLGVDSIISAKTALQALD